MKLHSDKLTYRDFLDAAALARVNIVDFEILGSRSRAKGFKFSLEGSSPYRRNFSNDGPAATWDEWGIFLAHLFSVDCQSHCGARGYRDEEHFHWCTGNRFRTLTPQLQHKRHKWEYQGSACTGSYSVAECQCGALQRWEVQAS
jgi:hypothetical protein